MHVPQVHSRRLRVDVVREGAGRLAYFAKAVLWTGLPLHAPPVTITSPLAFGGGVAPVVLLRHSALRPAGRSRSAIRSVGREDAEQSRLGLHGRGEADGGRVQQREAGRHCSRRRSQRRCGAERREVVHRRAVDRGTAERLQLPLRQIEFEGRTVRGGDHHAAVRAERVDDGRGFPRRSRSARLPHNSRRCSNHAASR